MLKYKADQRSLLFMLIATSFLLLQWMRPEISISLFLGSCFMATLVFCIVHNHNHLPIWKNSLMNVLQDYWLTIFYGYPVFAWIPTHNQNHHVLNNKTGDDSMTYRHTESNHLFSILSYPLVSGGAQQRRNLEFLKYNWKSHRPLFFYYLSQLLVLILFDALALYLDWKKALFAIVIPQQISLNGVLMINYIQHVHTDEESRWNHSRNFVGKISNWLTLNNGFHTVHHERPLQHWSLNQDAHEKIKHHISPKLCERGLATFILRTYFLSLIFKKFRTHSLRLERLKKYSVALG